MLDRPHIRNERYRLLAQPPVPVSEMLVGKPIEQVVEVLPRLFNLCRVAQSVAIRQAFGMPVTDNDLEALRVEILTDHAQKLLVMFPRALGMPPICAMPKRSDDIADRVFGGFRCPGTRQEFVAFLNSDEGVAPLLRAVMSMFGPDVAVSGEISHVFSQTKAMENSAAARHRDHPVMQYLERSHGRGMLWRCFARLLDVEMYSARIPKVRCSTNGWVQVPTARGAYFVKTATCDGVMIHLNRVTPTDHMLAPGGIAEQTLASVPAGKTQLAELAITLLDPCSPVTVRQEVAHA